MQVIFLLTTDRQSVNYYSTIHAIELIYFDSNTRNDEKAVVSFRFFQLSAIALKKNPPKDLLKRKHLHAFLTFIKRKNDVTPSNVQE